MYILVVWFEGKFFSFISDFFWIFFWIFSFLSLPSVDTRQSLCRVSEKQHSAKTALPAEILPCGLYRVWHSVKALSSVFRPLDKAWMSRSEYMCRIRKSRADNVGKKYFLGYQVKTTSICTYLLFGQKDTCLIGVTSHVMLGGSQGFSYQ